MSYFGVSTRNGVGLGLGTVPSLTNTPLGYRLAPSLNLSFAGSDTLDPSITFSRTTNATLTNSAGLVANAPMNLLTFSEQFDNASWVKTNATITANAAIAPNGTLTADKFVEAVGAGSKYISTAVFSPNVYVFSIDIKYSNKQYFWASIDGSTTAVFFDVLNGTVASTGSGNTGSITPSGGGWYRCTVTKTTASSFGLYFGTSNSPSSYETTGNGVDGIYIWGAQLELGSTATTYNPTTVKNLLGFTEHFDNAAWTKSNAFVQTNLLTYSQDFDNAAWTPAGTVTPNVTLAPDGTLTADRCAVVSGAALSQIVNSITAGINYTVSVWAKSSATGGASNVRITTNNTGAWNTGVSQIYALTSEWQRITISGAIISSGTSVRLLIGAYTVSGGGDATCAGNIDVWGAQLVQGASAGDYKATYAAAAAVGYTDIYGQPFAQKLVENTAAATQHLINNSYATAGTSQTLSIYAKAAERTQFAIQLGTNASFFDLSAGTVISGPGNIQSIGNGWYRCSLSGTPTNANTLFYLGVGGSATYTGDGTSGIYIFGAQLSDSASVDPYVYQPVAAPSSVAYYGPRFDYDPATLAPKGLLIEEQRTNLCLYSGAVGGTGWVSTNGGAGAIPTVTLNAAVAPDGTSTASRVQLSLGGGTTTTDQSLVVQALTGTSCRGSFYVKTNDNSTKTIYARGLNAASFVVDGTWRRYDFDAGTLSGTQFGIGLRGGQGTANSNTADILIWGAQLEAGAFPTSYIPTVASQVTRAADSASMIGNNFARWYNQTEGTFMVQGDTAKPTSLVASAQFMTVSNGTVNNNHRIRYITAGIDAVTVVGGAIQVDTNEVGYAANVSAKVAYAYQVNDYGFTVNGGTVQTITSATVPVVNSLQLGGFVANATPLNGHLQRFAYYNRRLSNTEEQGITS